MSIHRRMFGIDSYFPMIFPIEIAVMMPIQTMPLGMWTKSEQTDEHAEIRDEIETLSSCPCISDSDTMENADEIEMASDAMLRRLSRRSIPGDAAGAGELGRHGPFAELVATMSPELLGRVGRLEPRRCIDGEKAIDPPPPGLIRPLSRGLWVNCLRGSTPTFAGSMRVPALMAEAILSRDRNATFTGSTKTPWCCGHRK